MCSQFFVSSVIVVACLFITICSAAAQDGLRPEPAMAAPAMAPGRAAPYVDRAEKPLLLPPSVEYGLGDLRANVAVALPPLDHAALIEEDIEDMEESGYQHKALRVGVPREILLTDVSGVWQSMPDVGYVWSTSIVSAEAYEMRLHFTEVDLPEGARLWVYSLEDDLENWWSFEEKGPFGEGEFWTPETMGEHVIVEYVVPIDSVFDGDLPAAPFMIDQLQHVYRELRVPPDGGLRDISCMADSACWSPWDTVRNSVARITYVDPPYMYQCSGQLLDTEAGDLTPYFNTANHCISTQAVAQTLSARFFYQRETCGGLFATSRTSTYADLVSTYAYADATLLMIKGRLRNDVTPAMYWSGWTSDSVPYGTDIVGIHHPEGTWKRISFGDKRSTTTVNIEGQIVYAHEARWTEPPDPPGGDTSVTTFGSSGSGMWIESSELVVGHLSGGSSSCSQTAGSDYYGRFNYAYDNAPGWSAALVGGSDDDLEDNDACVSAVPITSGTYNDRVVKSLDEDWYKFDITPCQSFDLSVTFTHDWGDIDVHIYDDCGGSVVSLSESYTDNESLTFAPTTAGTYYMRIYLHTDTRNEYDFTTLIYDDGTMPPSGSCDFDCNGIVQADDLEEFDGCYTGPDAGPIGPGCYVGDTDGDDDLDLEDFQQFQNLCVD